MFPFLLFSNIIHKFSHMRNCEKNRIIRLLQKLGIFCSSEDHKLHHIYPNTKYCVNTKFLNPILDNIGFWRLLEFIVSLFGIKVDRKNGYGYFKSTHIHDWTEKEKCPRVINKKEKVFLINTLSKLNGEC